MQSDHEDKRPPRWFLLLLAAAFVTALAGLLWSYSLAGRLTHAEAQLAATQKQNQQLSRALDQTNAKLRITSQTLGQRLGRTQQQLRRRAADLLHRRQAAAKRLQQEQQSTQMQVSSATSNLSDAKSNTSGVQIGLQQTPSQLTGDKAQMKKMQGDLGIQSGLIATNQRELKVLQNMGERNYYPFTLHKGKKQAVANVALLLRRVNVRRNTYTLTVFSDNHKIEKKDRALDEPVQFYTGQKHLLFELIVNKISRRQVQGYLSTPKTTPTPAAATQNGQP